MSKQRYIMKCPHCGEWSKPLDMRYYTGYNCQCGKYVRETLAKSILIFTTS